MVIELVGGKWSAISAYLLVRVGGYYGRTVVFYIFETLRCLNIFSKNYFKQPLIRGLPRLSPRPYGLNDRDDILSATFPPLKTPPSPPSFPFSPSPPLPFHAHPPLILHFPLCLQRPILSFSRSARTSSVSFPAQLSGGIGESWGMIWAGWVDFDLYESFIGRISAEGRWCCGAVGCGLSC